MGLYDYLKISASKLPLSSREKQIIDDSIIWQTKDFDCMLTVVRITNEGKVRYLDVEYDWDDNAKGSLYHLNGQLGAMVAKKQYWIDIPYHGFIMFGKTVNGIGYRFKAKFTDGILVNIERVD